MSLREQKRLAELDHQYVWHPFTQMKGWFEEEPLIVARGQGDWLYDVLGRAYLDGVSSLWVTVHGHNRPEINRAIREQAEEISHSTLLGLASPPSIELAARLARITPPGLVKTFYSDSGATAVEIALKIVFQYWRQAGRPERKLFAGLNLAYHGDTLGAVSVGGMELFHGVYRPLLFETIRLPAPYCYRCELKREPETCGLACAAAAEEILDREGATLAGLIIEPLVQGAAGMIVHPAGYLARVAAACRRNGVLLIADEVAVGFGRTGRMFACEWEDVAPDVLCLGKGLTGGYLPLAATLTTKAVFDGFLGEYDEFRTFFHGHTFTGNPVACAAALASLDLFDRDRTLANLPPKIELLAQSLSRLAGRPHVGQVRQRGMMAGIELVEDRATRAPYAPGRRLGHRVILEARRHGVILRPLGDVIVIMPPLSISMENLTRLLEVTEKAILTVTEGAGE
ncbi:MAG: adenosylmethionine--8-amino-7-oxononanoate transaminase [Thermodesulfobacteriota bacterium]